LIRPTVLSNDGREPPVQESAHRVQPVRV